jgi:hypothetical protein
MSSALPALEALLDAVRSLWRPFGGTTREDLQPARAAYEHACSCCRANGLNLPPPIEDAGLEIVERRRLVEDPEVPPGYHTLTPPSLAAWAKWQMAVEALIEAARRISTSTGDPGEYVDLDQIAATVHCKKDSLKPYKRRKHDPLPDPDVRGGGGKRDYWRWSTVRPWLIRNFAFLLPEHPPNFRLPHS